MADTIAGMLEDSARRFGPRPALYFKPGFRYRTWSYAQLWEEAGRVAGLLQDRGLRKGDRVLLWAPNSPYWVIAFFGCMRAGVVVVPIDLRSAGDFVERVASKTQPKIAFVSRFTPVEHQALAAPRVLLEELETLCEGLTPPKAVEVGPAELAEIMFTSGTTGSPKGVMLTHRNLLSDVEAASQHIPGKPRYRLLSILPLSHMFEQTGCLLMALGCGASITYPTSRQPTVLLRTMRERRITTLLLVPQALDLFMSGVEREVKRQGKERLWGLSLRAARHAPTPLRRLLFRRVHQRFGGSLDFIVSGGAALDPRLGEKWGLLGVKVIQGYGATEASPVISTHKLTRPRFDSVGPPLPGVEVKISDEGEVLVRGPNVTPGYWDAPAETAAAFVDGWYKTGDLGSIDGHGCLHLKGRKKDMIVLQNGMKVFPEDIEAVLNGHPAVKEAVVVGLAKDGVAQVHAALLFKGLAAPEEVVAWANRQLAEHQQIRGSTAWPGEDFPRTHTLKVRKAVLAEMLRDVQAGAATPPPASATKAEPDALERVIAEVSGLPIAQITPDKDLGRDLDMDSLKRVELLSAIEEEIGASVDEALVGPWTTVAQLRKIIEAGGAEHDTVPFPRWGMSLWCRFARGGFQRTFIFPLAAVTYHMPVKGAEHLEGLKGPVLFAANHNLHWDNGLLIKSMPLRWRRRLAIAADADLFRTSAWAIINPLLGNGFPFAKEGPIRPSLENLGRVLDGGWSVLIYPEGKLTIGGPIQPFKSGVGLIAVEAKVPVVPVKLEIHHMGAPPQLPILRRGSVEVRFGKPLTFEPGTAYPEAARQIEEAVRGL